MRLRTLIIAGFLILAALGASQTFYVVEERNQAIVLRFGEFSRETTTPGLHMKIPFMESVIFYDRRILGVDPPAEEVLLTDQRRLIVDTYARYRITDPRLFYQTMTDVANANTRLHPIIIAALRSTLGEVTQLDILSDARVNIMAAITRLVAERSRPFGIEIVDVRIVRAELPSDTLQSVFARMRSEREREAAQLRAQGNEAARVIRATADREVRVIIAEAEREAQSLRGTGDSDSIRVLANAYSQDAAFFIFYRSLDAYRQSMTGEGTTMVLSPDSTFFRYFLDADPTAVAATAGVMPLETIPIPELLEREGPTGFDPARAAEEAQQQIEREIQRLTPEDSPRPMMERQFELTPAEPEADPLETPDPVDAPDPLGSEDEPAEVDEPAEGLEPAPAPAPAPPPPPPAAQ